MHAKKYKEYISLSMQEILDCSTENMHCVGGQPSSVADYLIKYGLAVEQNYTYEAKKSHCRAKYFNNTIRQKSSRRILEELLCEPSLTQKSVERKLQSNGYNNRPSYFAKYDKEKGQFYYEVKYPNGTVKYVDLNQNPFTPSFIQNKSNIIESKFNFEINIRFKFSFSYKSQTFPYKLQI